MIPLSVGGLAQTVLAGQRFGIQEGNEGIWAISLIRHDLGFIGLEPKTLQSTDNPLGPGL